MDEQHRVYRVSCCSLCLDRMEGGGGVMVWLTALEKDPQSFSHAETQVTSVCAALAQICERPVVSCWPDQCNGMTELKQLCTYVLSTVS